MLREALGKVLPHAVRSRIKDLLRMPQVERSVALKGEVGFWQKWLSAFDIVHGQNCIDHTADPHRAIDQMVAVTRPGGWVVLYHAENEGQREQYNQLHQWDFTCEDGAFIIRDRMGRTVNVTHKLAALCDVECTRVGESPSAVPEGMDEAAVPREARPDAAILTGIRKRAPTDVSRQ